MEFLLGVQGRDFVMVASDCNQGRSIVRMKDGKALNLRSYKIKVWSAFKY